MRPHRSTEAHQTSDFAELVCSNSLKSESENSMPPGCSSRRCAGAGSILLAEADATAVPAGHALAVDRELFSARVAAERTSASEPRITVHREEVTQPHEESSIPIPSQSSPPARSPARHLLPSYSALPAHRALSLLRLHLAHRRRHHHRYGQGLLRRPLRQRHSRLHQLPVRPEEEYEVFLDRTRLPPNTSKPKTGKNCPVDYVIPSHGEPKLSILRRLSPHRRDRPPRPRHPPLRSHEARRPYRPEDRPLALRRRAASSGEPPRRQLQPRRIPEPPQVRGADMPASFASSPGSNARPSCATARSTATPTSTHPACLRRRSSSRPTQAS